MADDFYKRQTRGVLLTTVHTAYEGGFTDPANRRQVTRMVLEQSLQIRGFLPPADDLVKALDWMEGAGYFEVDWGMDDRTKYHSVTITQQAIALYENKKAAAVEPGIILPPRR